MDDQPCIRRVSPDKLRWYRFSLRNLLLVFTFVSICFGLFYNDVRNEMRAAKAIGDAYGRVVYDWQVRPDESAPNYESVAPGPEWVRSRLGPHWIDSIVEVRLNFHTNPVPANRYELVGPHLINLRSLRKVSIWGANLNDKEIELLEQLNQVQELLLQRRAKFTSELTAAISSMENLRNLSLRDVNIAPRELKRLARLTSLEQSSIKCSGTRSGGSSFGIRFR